jgi:hypothetical protein
MMADFLLHKGATLLCAHMSPAKPLQTFQRVKVSGQAIVIKTTTHKIQNCPNPPNSGGPCQTAFWITAATRVRAGGIPVLLKNSKAKCIPTQTGLTPVSFQIRVKGT